MKNLNDNCSVEAKILASLPKDKIEINWNTNPIQMNLFKSFITVPLSKSLNHLGSSNGWTLYTNDELNLKIKGGIVKNTEYLDDIRFGTKTQNPYNDYVNPFGIFHIMTDEGKQFFYDYYKTNIEELNQKEENNISNLIIKLSEANQTLKTLRTIKAKCFGG
jgi:hypothetical protein